MNNLDSVESVLELLKNNIENFKINKTHLLSNNKFNGFESLVTEVIDKLDLPPHIYFKENYGKHFPDIDLFINDIKYGVELKSRTNGSWVNNGGSVFESVTSTNYKEIFLLFGSINTVNKDCCFKVQYKPYWQALTGIKVTHKPRYYIDMNSSESIFNSNEKYESIRSATEQEKNIYVQEVLRKNSTKPQWYITESDEILPTKFNELTKEKKDKIIAEFLILYPHDLIQTSGYQENIKSNYDRISQSLVSTYFYYSPSVRDLFSAGGKIKINNVFFPRLLEKYNLFNSLIINILINSDEDFKSLAYELWSETDCDFTYENILDDFKTLIDYLGNSQFKHSLNKAKITSLSNIIFDYKL